MENKEEKEKEKNERLMKKIKDGLEAEVEKKVIFTDTKYFEQKEQMIEDVKEAVAKAISNNSHDAIKDSVKATDADPFGLWEDSSDDGDDQKINEEPEQVNSKAESSVSAAKKSPRKRKAAAK